MQLWRHRAVAAVVFNFCFSAVGTEFGCGPTDAVAGCLAKAQDAYQKQDLEVARQGFRKLCERKEARACGNLGELEAFQGNVAVGLRWYQRACALGDEKSCLAEKELATTWQKMGKNIDEQGKFYMSLAENHRRKEHLKSAVPVYRKACDVGFLPGCVGLGRAQGILGKHKEAEAALKLACEKGSQLGCTQWASILWSANHRDKAHGLFTKACQEKEGSACFSLGLMAEERHQESVAEEAFAKGCEMKDGGSCLGLASYFKKRNRRDEASDLIEQAKPLLASRCQQGYLDSCHLASKLR